MGPKTVNHAVVYRQRHIFNEDHVIQFYDLLEEGHNADKHCLTGEIYNRPDHDFDVFLNLQKDSINLIGNY